MSKKPLDKKFVAEVAKKILPDILIRLYNEGVLNEEDLSNWDSQKSKVLAFLKKKPQWNIIVDHRENLLEIAEEKSSYKELSISLYATFVEHTLNKIIHLRCTERNIDFKTQKEIINSNIHIKCTWLLKLLNLKPFKAEIITTIKLISDERNTFFHYKWQPEIDDTIPDTEKEKREYEEKIKKIKALIKYLKNYESRIQFKGKKGKIDRAIMHTPHKP